MNELPASHGQRRRRRPTARRSNPCATSRRAAGTARGPAAASPRVPRRRRSARRRPPTGGGRGTNRRHRDSTSGTLAARHSRSTTASGSDSATAEPATQLTSSAVPQPSVARASSRRCSAADSPATTSSQRNCGAAPSGAERARRTSDGQPANCRDSSSVRTSRHSDLARASTSVGVKASSSMPTSTTWPAARRSVERDRRACTAGENEVGMRWQLGDELAEQRRPPSIPTALRGRRRSRCTRRSGPAGRRRRGHARSVRHVRCPGRGRRRWRPPGGRRRSRRVRTTASASMPAGRPGWRGSPGPATSTCRTRHRRRSPSAAPRSAG